MIHHEDTTGVPFSQGLGRDHPDAKQAVCLDGERDKQPSCGWAMGSDGQCDGSSSRARSWDDATLCARLCAAPVLPPLVPDPAPGVGPDMVG